MLVTAREVKIQKRHKKQSFQNFILAGPDFLLKKDKYVANARKSQMSEYCSECLIQTYCNNQATLSPKNIGVTALLTPKTINIGAITSTKRP